MKRLVGAGVLCVSRDRDGEIVLLLGRERDVPGWRSGSRKWCSFSGRAEEGESALSSAAREFVEETCSAVALTDTASLPARVGEVARELAKARFVARTLRALPPATGSLCHVTFLCVVPYDETVVRRFETSHAELLELDEVFRAFHSAKKGAERLPRLLFPGHVLAESCVTVDLRAPPSAARDHDDDDGGGSGDAGATTAAAAQLELELDFVVDCGVGPGQTHTWRLRLPAAAAAEALAVAAAWARVQAFVREHGHREVFRHPAVQLKNHHGRLVSAYVQRGYLEKTELAWFRLAELEALDRWQGEQFRRHFLESLRQFAPQIRGLFAAAPACQEAAAAGAERKGAVAWRGCSAT